MRIENNEKFKKSTFSRIQEFLPEFLGFMHDGRPACAGRKKSLRDVNQVRAGGQGRWAMSD